jgi:hypothetical protein
MGLQKRGAISPHHLAKPAPNAITLHRRSNLLGDGEANPNRTWIATIASLNCKSRCRDPDSCGSGDKISPLPQSFHRESALFGVSGAQALAAAGAASSENLAAAGSGETGAEAVAALAHEFAGLIGPLHGSYSAGSQP